MNQKEEYEYEKGPVLKFSAAAYKKMLPLLKGTAIGIVVFLLSGLAEASWAAGIVSAYLDHKFRKLERILKQES